MHDNQLGPPEVSLGEKLLGIGILVVIALVIVGLYKWLGWFKFGIGVTFIVWYFLTWMEWELNGGGVGYPYPGWTKPFYALYHSLRCFSYEYCEEYAGIELRDENDVEWREHVCEHADMLYDSRWATLITPTIFLILPLSILCYNYFKQEEDEQSYSDTRWSYLFR